MKVKRRDLQSLLLITILYLAFSNFYYFIPEVYLNIKGFGKLYDLVFLGLIAISLTHINRGLRWFKKDAFFYCVFLAYLGFECIRTIGSQSVINSIRTVREFILFFIFLFICNINIKKDAILRFLLKLDLIGCAIYIIQFLLGTNILGAHYIYESLGGIRVLRSYAYLPEFDIFFFSYLLLSILNGRRVLGTKWLDIMAFSVIALTCVLHFTRGLWLSIIAIAALVVIVFYRKTFSWKKWIALGIGAFILFFVIPRFAPALVNRMILGVTQLGEGVGTAGIRINLLNSRIEYLRSHRLIAIGLGALNSDYDIYLNGGADYLSRMSSADSAWANIIIRYGFIGVVLSIMAFLIPAIKHVIESKGKDNLLEISYLLMVVSGIVMGFDGSASFGGTAFLKFGIIYGIVINQTRANVKDGSITPK